VGNDELIVHRRVNLGIAVDLENDGLVVPVLQDAQNSSIRDLARGIRDVASRARSKKLGVDELAHGTFTITNPGPYGTLLTGAIINQPQVAILSTDAVTERRWSSRPMTDLNPLPSTRRNVGAHVRPPRHRWRVRRAFPSPHGRDSDDA